MNTKSFINLTKNSMRQFGSVLSALAILSLFIVLMSVETKAVTYEYDDLNRVTKVIYDDQSYTLYEYDANGNIMSQSHYENNGNNPESGEKPGGETPGTGGNTDGDTDGDTNGDTPGIDGVNPEAGQGQQGNKDTSDQDNPAPKHKKGTKAKSKDATYVIASAQDKTATFYKFTNKKKKTYTVPNYVKIDGIKYKVTKISSKAFKNNKKLKKITIGKNITSVGKQAFYGCKNLKKIVIKSTKLKSVGKQALKGIHKKATIYVPRKKYTKYKKLLKNKGQKKTVKMKKR